VSGRLSEIKERVGKATPGPWEVEYDTCECNSPDDCDHWTLPYRLTLPEESVPEGVDHQVEYIGDFTNETVEFIAHSPDDIRWLIAEVERLRHAVALCVYGKSGQTVTPGRI
jgi:hypothetical protein